MRPEALAAVLADTSVERHNVTGGRPCRHCLDAWEQAERLLEHPLLASALATAGVLTEDRRTLDNGSAGATTDDKTGKTTTHVRPATVQRRYVTTWTTEEN